MATQPNIVWTPCQAFPSGLYKKFKRIHLNLHKTVQHIKFNNLCISNNIIPKYINVQIKNSSASAQKTKQIAQKIWLKNEIKSLYAKKQTLNTELYKVHLDLTKVLNNTAVFSQLVGRVEIRTNKVVEKMKATHKKKFTQLKSNQCHNTHAKYTHLQEKHHFHPRLINLTDTVLETNEIKLLEKGLKHNISTNIDENYIENLIVESENILLQENKKESSEVNIGLTRELVSNEIKNIITHMKQNTENQSNTDSITLKKLKKKLQQNNTIITRADKGNTVILMDKNQYISKIQEFITKNKITKLKSDPTNRFQTKLRNTLKNIEYTLEDNEIRKLIQTNPSAPFLRSQPKLHKKDLPVRVIVNYRNAPTYPLARHMLKIITENYKLENDKTIRNTTQLIQHIKNIQVPDSATLLSFDVENMYTNIPVTETINIIQTNLQTHSTLPQEYITEIIKLLELITEQNYFQFNNEFYIQSEGLPMGSPISGTIANIFMNHIEQVIFNKIVPNRYKIIYWLRYMDDILCLIDEPSCKIDQLYSDINSVHDKIQFTIEKEQNRQLNFLDVTIKIQNHQHTFDIYRKPTTTDTIIHQTSNHPETHKHAALRYMLHRLNTIPLDTDNYQKEMNTIVQIATNNGYKENLVTKLNNKIKKQKNTPVPSSQRQNTTQINTQDTHTRTTQSGKSEENKRWYTMTYNNKYTHRISNIFRKQGIKIAHQTNNSLQKHFPKSIENTDPYRKSGIYQLKCNTCDGRYIGQTRRTFDTRYKEHVRAWKYKTSHSTFAEHLHENQHKITTRDTDMEIIRINNNKKHLLTLQENYHIQKTITEKKHLINDQTNLANHTLFKLIDHLT